MPSLRTPIALLLIISPVAAFAVFPHATNDPADTFFQFVGRVGGGSGVAVGANKVLTAKHVGGTIGDTFSLPDFGGAGDFTITSRVENPDADFVVLTVSGTLPGWYNVSTTDPSVTGQQITMVGWGASGVLRSDGTGYASDGLGDRRRTGTNTVFGKATLDLPDGFNSPYTGQHSDASISLIARLTQNGDAALGGGDSGGGWFIQENGEFRVTGINSFVGTFGTWTDNYGFSSSNANFFGSGAVDLTSYGAFLIANDVTPVPEPATMAVLGLGALTMLRRRKSAR